MTKANKARRRYAVVKVSRLLFGWLFHLRIIREGEKMIERAAVESRFVGKFKTYLSSVSSLCYQQNSSFHGNVNV